MIYYVPRFGLGNIIQTTPAVRWLAKQGSVSIVRTPATCLYVDTVFRDFSRVDRIPKGAAVFKSVNPRVFTQGGSLSEVAANLQAVGCAPIDEDRQGFCPASEGESFDVVIANGYNKTKNLTDWEAKTYPHWPEVIAGLPGLRVACVGLEGEAIPGAENRTGISLTETLSIIRSAKVFASNDTGLYHAAAAMGVKGVVLFTFTDRVKNYDPVFHRSINLVARYLPCSPCQLKGRGYWNAKKAACGWECRNIDPAFVAEAIRRQL